MAPTLHVRRRRLSTLLPTVAMLLPAQTSASVAAGNDGEFGYFDAATMTHVYPMTRYTQATEPFAFIGTDPHNCSSKDPSSVLARKTPATGYLEVSFTLEAAELATVTLLLFTPDSMSDSFWSSVDGGAPVAWHTPRLLWGSTPFAPKSEGLPQVCHALSAGNHTFRLLVREPGASVGSVAVHRAAAVAVDPGAAQEGCSGRCLRSGGTRARFSVENMCGRGTVDQMSVTVGGAPCTEVTLVDATTLACVAPAYKEADDEAPVVVTQAGNAVALTLLYEPDQDDGRGVGAFLLWTGVAGGIVAAAAGIGTLWLRRMQRAQVERLFGASVLAAEMAEAIACLDFDALEKLETLEKPDRVQAAMKNIMDNMKEFVKYLPHHVLKTVRKMVESDDDDDDDDEDLSEDDTYADGTTRCSPTPPSTPGKSRSDGATSRGTESVAGVSVDGSVVLTVTAAGGRGRRRKRESCASRASRVSGRVLRGAMVARTKEGRRAVAVAVVRPRLYLGDGGELSADADAHTALLTVVYAALELAKGCLHRVCEDCVVATWGAIGPPSFSTIRLLRAATAFAESGYHTGVYGCLSRCAYVGNNNVRAFSVLGGVVEEADALSRVAVACAAPVVAKAALLSGLGVTEFLISPFFPVVLSTSWCDGRNRVLETAVCVGVLQAANEEWMYELEQWEARCGIETVLSELLKTRCRTAALTMLDAHTEWVRKQSAAGVSRLATWLERYLLEATSLSAASGAFSPPVLEVTTGGVLLSAGKVLPYMGPTQISSKSHMLMPAIGK